MSKKSKTNTHSYIPELVSKLRKGEVTRRDFLQTATLLGVSAGAAYTMAGMPAPGRKAHAAAKKGGNLRVSMNVKATDDPATFDWSEKGNVARHVTEPLVRVGEDGLARPYLAESWSASEDLKTWTFNLRKNATWSNGDSFGADDVIHNFRRWLDPNTGS
ncbi:MAG: twin-arginine translocation signal domain-containing protein, partial [Rhodospirillaceae bacterium]|nr:twin-arginine translocation signal domain-containing protein [Rhodospirillaceae bacterium]